MNYTFQFGVAFAILPELLQGALSPSSWVWSLSWGARSSASSSLRSRPMATSLCAAFAQAYVVFFTNTPALIQIYFLYFGLPEFGIRWDNFVCVLIGLILNSGAYLTEIMRAGFLSVRATEMEAAEALGLIACSRSAS